MPERVCGCRTPPRNPYVVPCKICGALEGEPCFGVTRVLFLHAPPPVAPRVKYTHAQRRRDAKIELRERARLNSLLM